MSNQPKKSVLIDLSENPVERGHRNKGLLFILIPIVLSGIVAVAFFLVSGAGKFNHGTTPKTLETDDAKLGEVMRSSELTQPVVSGFAEPVLPTPQSGSFKSMMIPAVEMNRDEQPAPGLDESEPRDHLDDIMDFYASHAELKRMPLHEEECSALVIQLQKAQGDDRATLENAYAVALIENLTDAVTREIGCNRRIVEGDALQTYAALEWNEVEKKLEALQALEAQGSNWESLLIRENALQSMMKFQTAAVATLSELAANYQNQGEIEMTKSMYRKILTLQPKSEPAIRFLHRHAFPAGTERQFTPVGLTMCFIPAGSYIMGTPEYEIGRDEDEWQHPVTQTRAFFLSKREITQNQWLQVMGRLPGQLPQSEFKPELPVHSVSWHEAMAFCRQLCEIDPEGNYRLPTEAEWEYACRAGSAEPYNNRSNRLELSAANIFDPGAVGNKDAVVAVGQYEANAWGLQDMHGNVWEWTLDWMQPYEELPALNPVADKLSEGADENLSTKVLRGGSYYDEAGFARSGNRWDYAPSVATEYIGFRVVREVRF